MAGTSGTSRFTTRVSIRLPNELVRTLERRINGSRSRWSSVGEYLQERIIYDVERKHYRLNKDKRSSFKKLQKEVKDGSQNSR